MGSQNFVHVINNSPLANLTAITATTETALVSPSLYCPITPDIYLLPQRSWKQEIWGICSFASTGTLTINPRWGTSTGGTTMGASIAKAVPGSATTNQPFKLELDVFVRTVNGASSTVIGHGTFTTNPTTAAGTAFVLNFGGTEATVDLTTASGLCIGWTLSVAGSVTPQWNRLTEYR